MINTNFSPATFTGTIKKGAVELESTLAQDSDLAGAVIQRFAIGSLRPESGIIQDLRKINSSDDWDQFAFRLNCEPNEGEPKGRKLDIVVTHNHHSYVEMTIHDPLEDKKPEDGIYMNNLHALSRIKSLVPSFLDNIRELVQNVNDNKVYDLEQQIEYIWQTAMNRKDKK